MKTNYSVETSLPAYYSKKNDKDIQKARILKLIPHIGTCLKELEEKTGLPQSTVAARINDLIKENKVHYFGKYCYKNMYRKRIFIKETQPTQQILF